MYPTVKYELKELEKLIGSHMQHVLDKYAVLLTEEIERIKQAFIYEVFHIGDERLLERYIQYHQQALIYLIDMVDLSLQKKDIVKEFYAPTHTALYDLLNFIEKHFAKYFDQDAKAPTGYLAMARKEARSNAKKLAELLQSKNADPTLSALLLRVLNRVTDGTSEKSNTYRRIMYGKEMQKELFRVAESASAIDEDLRHVMYYLNYNSSKVVTYFAHYISSQLDAVETRAEKIEKLSLILKTVSQAQVKPGIGYNMYAAPLRSQLTEYVSVEIDYQERLQQLTTRPPSPPSDNFMSGFKLKFEASVSQLAYLLKVLIDMKIIVNSNLTQVLNFLVRFVITRRSENISYGSFRSKFYNVETGTKESVRNMLISIVHHIEKN